jgi:hypothetical protein
MMDSTLPYSGSIRCKWGKLLSAVRVRLPRVHRVLRHQSANEPVRNKLRHCKTIWRARNWVRGFHMFCGFKVAAFVAPASLVPAYVGKAVQWSWKVNLFDRL